MKVTCERIVLDGAASAMVIRPGLIVGPEDPTGRFSLLAATARGRRDQGASEVLAPGDPADVMQVVDVRDLAAWAVTACEQRTTGVYDGVGPAMPISDLLAQCAEGVTSDVTWTWVDQEFLQEQEVEPWMGPGAIPLWLPRPEYDGLPAHDVQPSLDAGLTVRPLADTTRDTLAWLEATPRRGGQRHLTGPGTRAARRLARPPVGIARATPHRTACRRRGRRAGGGSWGRGRTRRRARPRGRW